MATRRDLRWLPWAVAALLLALLAWVGSGPWRTIDGIRQAVKTEDARALARHVDFPALRTSLKPQVQDRIVRAAGAEAQSGPFAAFGLTVATGLAGGLVDAMVTPAGLGALMEGRKVWNRVGGIPPPTRSDTGAQPDPIPDPRLRFESLSRMSATVTLDDRSELVLVLTRNGTRWRLSEIRLPAPDAPPTAAPGGRN
ncbi:DUF2939 domain-containing protein [Luteimonas sp. MJ250]|uniref:DUF2939 domain-containing protein n=1 Tax=Luteimonas sp. MJ250 TaxID=3129236 RepID=UPI0031BB6A25